MIIFKLYLVVAFSICTIEAGGDDHREESSPIYRQIFSYKGPELKPDETVDLLKRLVKIYTNRDDRVSAERMKKVKDLLEVSQVDKTKCNDGDFMEKVGNIFEHYSHRLVNVFPYLKHYIEKQLDECKDVELTTGGSITEGKYRSMDRTNVNEKHRQPVQHRKKRSRHLGQVFDASLKQHFRQLWALLTGKVCGAGKDSECFKSAVEFYNPGQVKRAEKQST